VVKDPSESLRRFIRPVRDFPRKGILFRDITPLLLDEAAFGDAIEVFYRRYLGMGIDKIVSIEARGFILGSVLAYRLGIGFVPVRKPNKLPAETIREALEGVPDREALGGRDPGDRDLDDAAAQVQPAPQAPHDPEGLAGLDRQEPRSERARIPELVDVAEGQLERRLDEILGLDGVEGDRPGCGEEDRRLPLEGRAERHRVHRTWNGNGRIRVRAGGGPRPAEVKPGPARHRDGDHTLSEATAGWTG